MSIPCAIRLSTLGSPPSADLSFVRNEDRRLTLSIAGVPSGLTVTKVVVTGKATAAAPDAAETFQKVLTTGSTLATVGRITDTGASGTATAVVSFTPADSVSWPDAQVVQVWAICSDGSPYCVLTGSIASVTPMPRVIGVALDPTLPPVHQDAIVLAFDCTFGSAGQTHASRIGPTFQLGSTSGVDTNDPTLDGSTPPTRYVMGADDYLTAGDALDAAWSNPAGFSILAGFELSASDVAGGFRAILCKDSSAAARTFYILNGLGKLQVALFDGTNVVTWDGATVLGAGLHRLVLTYDPTQPLASRLTVRIDESADTLTKGGSATLNAIANTAAELTIGGRPNSSFGFIQSARATQNVYAWNGVALSGADALTVSQWLRDTKGWA